MINSWNDLNIMDWTMSHECSCSVFTQSRAGLKKSSSSRNSILAVGMKLNFHWLAKKGFLPLCRRTWSYHIWTGDSFICNVHTAHSNFYLGTKHVLLRAENKIGDKHVFRTWFGRYFRLQAVHSHFWQWFILWTLCYSNKATYNQEICHFALINKNLFFFFHILLELLFFTLTNRLIVMETDTDHCSLGTLNQLKFIHWRESCALARIKITSFENFSNVKPAVKINDRFIEENQSISKRTHVIYKKINGFEKVTFCSNQK